MKESCLLVKKCKKKTIYRIAILKNLDIPRKDKIMLYENHFQLRLKWQNSGSYVFIHVSSVHASLNGFYLPYTYPAGNYIFKVNNKNTRSRCEIYSKLRIKTPEDAIGVVVSLLLTLNIFHIVSLSLTLNK